MNGVIELPPETNPLNSQTLYHILSAASSSDQQQVQTASQQLQYWEKQSGYYSSLQVPLRMRISDKLRETIVLTIKPSQQSICIEHSLPWELRLLALIQLKNGIDKYWRKTASKYGDCMLTISLLY